MTRRLFDFLAQFRLLNDKYDAIARASGERFNVFSILDRESNEVKTHSAFLAELLNPKGTHSQGANFLNLFFRMLTDRFGDKFEIDDAESNNFIITTEASGKYGRIDILMESKDKCIVIENKIYAADQERQLGRYYDYARDHYDDKNITVIYLTLWGKEPDDGTLSGDGQKYFLDKDKVLCVSYAKHIIAWLEDCIKSVARISNIRETLFQYQALLKKLTRQTINQEFIMETNNLFSENENYKLIPSLEKAIKPFRVHLQHQFWKSLCKELKRKIKNKPSDTEWAVIEKPFKEQLKEFMSTNDYIEDDTGFEFIVLQEEDVTICVRILDHHTSGVFICFQVQENGKMVADGESYGNQDYQNKYGKYAEAIGWGMNSWCLGCNYYKYNGELFIFRDLSESLMGEMVCEDGRKRIAKDIVKNVIESIKLLHNGKQNS